MQAIEFRAGQNVTIAADEIVDDDLYVTGEVVRIDGLVRGDVFAAGREISFSGAALGDLTAAGQSIVVAGSIADDVRMAGMALRIDREAAIGDDLIASGLSLDALPGSVVDGSVVFNGGQARLAGDVHERFLGSMAALRIEGRVDQGGEVGVDGRGDVLSFARFIPSPVSVPEVPAGFTLAPEARIAGKLVYISPHPVESDVENSHLVHVEVAGEDPEPGFGAQALTKFRRWVGVATVGLLLALLAPRWFSARLETLDRPVTSAAWGLGALMLLPLAFLLAVAGWILTFVLVKTVGLGGLAAAILASGLSLALTASVTVWLAFAFVAPAATAAWIGRSLARRGRNRTGAPLRLGWAIVLGTVVLTIVVLIPLVGELSAFLAALLGFGSLAAWLTGFVQTRLR
jgi:hypothetical protein